MEKKAVKSKKMEKANTTLVVTSNELTVLDENPAVSNGIDLNVGGSMTIELFGQEIKAVCEVNSNGAKILVFSEKDNIEVTLVNIASALNDYEITFNPADLTPLLNALGFGDDIKFEIPIIFMLIEIIKDANTNNLEFAFQIKVNSSPSDGIFNLKEISLAVWNTKRDNILKKMELEKIEDILNNI